MKIHEYQAKEILKKFGVTVPPGEIAFTPEEAYRIAKDLGGTVVVKAQIHAGGRGKGGGVKVVKSAEEVREAAKKMIGINLITHQTGPQGTVVNKVLVEKGCSIAKELYLGVVLDRSKSRLTIMASTEGGVEIEEVAAKHPEKILKVAVDPAVGFQAYQGRWLGFGLGLKSDLISKFVKLVGSLYNAYVAYDCSLAEINPLVITSDNEILALDAKINFDDNALFRHKDAEEMRDPNEEDPNETLAKKYDLSYIALDGNIGCMVNGAGLAMATMDIIKLYGGEPANFLDVGGGATAEKVTAAFKIILSDSKVKAILVNIFGGIMKCDVIATGVVAAAKELGLKVPLVVRLLGTNVELGKKILADSGLPIISADRMDEAAEKVVKAIQ
jgi:succinyl-CoA synthetase beta subunit